MPETGTATLVPPTVDAREALEDLHRARRRNHRDVVHWVDALYKVYLTAFCTIAFVIIASGWFPDAPLDAAGIADLGDQGPAWVGLAAALALGIGLRSGGRGGPLALEAPSVQHELLAPVDRGTTLRLPAVKQLRFLTFAGTVIGGCIGVLAARRLPTYNAVEVVLAPAVTFALATLAAPAAAMTLSGRRFGIWVANGIAVVLLAWSALDLTTGLTTSPQGLLGELAFWPISFRPQALIGVALVVGLAYLALTGLGGSSLEAARRRAGLVSQLRFAVTLQDIRTVVLLRRQLAQEGPRDRPWIRLGRRGRVPSVWRRDWEGYLRFPAVRVVRLVVLAAAAGIALGFTWRGTTPAIIGAALCLFLAAYEAVEPVAQETDHPSRWDSLGGEHGVMLLRHLPAAAALLVLLELVTAAAALILVPPVVVGRLGVVLILPVAAAAVVGASVGTVLSSNTSSSLRDGVEMTNTDLQMSAMDPNTMGFMQVFRLAFPPALPLIALLPALAAGSDPEAIDVQRVSNLTAWSLVLLAGALAYLRFRRPSRI